MTDELYKTKIKLASEQAYDEIGLFLRKLSFGTCYTKEGLRYFLDKNHEVVAEMNLKKNTIGLTNKVGGYILDSINHINHQERVR